MARALASGDQPTAGYGARHGSCSGRGRCRDDLFAKQAERAAGTNMSVLLSRGQGDCDCNKFFSGTDCSSGQCPAGKQLSAESGTDVRQCEPCAAGHFKAKAGNQACARCPPNHFNTGVGNHRCTACPPGRQLPLPFDVTPWTLNSQTSQPSLEDPCRPLSAKRRDGSLPISRSCVPRHGPRQLGAWPVGWRASTHHGWQQDSYPGHLQVRPWPDSQHTCLTATRIL